MRDLVVYYSQGGNTAYAAEALARLLDADLLRVEPEKSYPSKGFAKFFWGGKSSVMAEAPVLRPYSFQAAEIDRVIIGFPVWAGSFAPPIRTFLRENRKVLASKRVAAFACQSGSGAERAFGKLRESLGGRELDATLILVDPRDKPSPENENRLRDFARRLGL